MIEITHHPIATDEVLASVNSEESGANVLFVGTTRRMTAEKETVKLDYECYEAMAIKKMQQLCDDACQRWPVNKCSIVHRVGAVGLGESSIAVAVSTPHRLASFESAQWLVDSLKTQVPIWKREFWVDGSTEWVHPEDAIIGTSPTPTESPDP